MSRRWLVVALLPFAVGCTSVAQITTLTDPACQASLRSALAKIFEAEGESAGVAEELAESTAVGLETWGLGPRPFLVASPSGVDYSLFVEKKKESCVLRLYGRQKGFVSYTNNINYIQTEPLGPCQCSE